ncbi:MAG: deoxyribonuclease V [bacterium]|nr:deoxyribonuclease V [bacterium]
MNNITEQEAVEQQEQLSKQVITSDELPEDLRIVAGVDVAYEKDGDRVVGAIVTFNAQTLEELETVVVTDIVSFPYIPGLFSFRELPPLLKAIDRLATAPDLIVCDGQGISHPRRFGMASHLGVVTGIATIGCAKKRLIGEYEKPGETRGSYSPLIDNGEIIGRALRTQDNTKPLFVSAGHKISLETACAHILELCTEFRLPETTRAADHAVNMKMKEIVEGA